jgi:hypothetical protein
MPFTRPMANTASTSVTSTTSAKAPYSFVDIAIGASVFFMSFPVCTSGLFAIRIDENDEFCPTAACSAMGFVNMIKFPLRNTNFYRLGEQRVLLKQEKERFVQSYRLY